ncbi:hypothetical protein HOC80_02925 [archaeon]|jgi:hypothetical protein|nr:hypothetical protein [archaeon]MBT4417032.1 hypothetical protein [archaeon]
MNLNNNIERVGKGQKKIAIVSLVHGDEIEGLEISRKVRKRIDGREIFSLYFIKANYRAYQERKRFIDKDLNRVFPGNKEGCYEERLAYDLVKILQQMDLVIDLHSTKAKSDPFFILTRKDESLLNLISGRGINKVCLMNSDVANGKALIDFCRGFSLEIPEGSKIDRIVDFIISLLGCHLEVFSVYRIINKNILFAENFKELSLFEETFYPVLFGEDDYEFTCLAAKKGIYYG